MHDDAMPQDGHEINPHRRYRGGGQHPRYDGDRKQARSRVALEIRCGRIPHPSKVSCVDCGHIWAEDGRKHEYDHHLGYDAVHHAHVQAVCIDCHVIRDSPKLKQTHCVHGHEYTFANTIRKANGTRTCRECNRRWQREYKLRRSAR